MQTDTLATLVLAGAETVVSPHSSSGGGCDVDTVQDHLGVGATQLPVCIVAELSNFKTGTTTTLDVI